MQDAEFVSLCYVLKDMWHDITKGYSIFFLRLHTFWLNPNLFPLESMNIYGIAVSPLDFNFTILYVLLLFFFFKLQICDYLSVSTFI